MSRRLTRNIRAPSAIAGSSIVSMADAGHVELQPGILCGKVKFKVAVFLRIGRQLIGPDRNRAPLKALADIPGRLPAGPPRRKMLELPAKFAEPLPANPFERALFRGVAVDAGEVELPDFARRQRLSALIGVLRRRAPDVDG